MRPVWNLPLDPSGVLVELDNDTTVRIRPVRKSDRDALLSAFEHFSAESRYMRFFSPRPRLTEKMIETFTDVDDVSQLAWAVFDPNERSEVGDESGLAIASARLFVDEDPTSAEATLAVVDDYQRRGLGRFLIELLLNTASLFDIEVVRFEVLYANQSMRGLLTKVGASAHTIPEDRTVVEYRLPVPGPDDIDVPMGALYSLLRAVEADDEPDE